MRKASVLLSASLMVLSFCVFSSPAWAAVDCYKKCQTPEQQKKAMEAASGDKKSCEAALGADDMRCMFAERMRGPHQTLLTWPCFKSCAPKAGTTACDSSIKKTEAAHKAANGCFPVDFKKPTAPRAFAECFDDFSTQYGAFEKACL